MGLSITYDELRREIGKFLNYGRDPSLWTGDKAYRATDVADVIRAGARRFYWPMIPVQKFKDGPVTQERYVWSFMSVNDTLDLVVGESTYTLPAGVTDIISETFSYESGSNLARIARIDNNDISAIKSASAMVGDPRYYAIRTRPVGPNGVTSYEVEFYPTPNAARTVSYTGSISPPDLDEDNVYHLGGPQYSAAFLEACLAEAEKALDDLEGLHEKRFRELLAAAIELDRKLAVPDVVDAWPLENTASDLEVNKAYLKRLIGIEMRIGPHSSAWSHAEAQAVKLALETGLRKFYSPTPLPGEKYAHEWSFLRPVHYMQLQSGVWKYDLPDDFAMLKGDQILYEPGSAVLWAPIRLVSERIVQRRQEQTQSSARPEIAAYRPKSPSEATSTRFEMVFFPTPDSSYNINFPYSVNPGALSDDVALPLGGQPHMQTVIEACLAAVEQIAGKPGVHSGLFLECLRASVSHDRMVQSPDSMGFNRLQEFGVNMGIYAGNFPIHNCSDNVTSYNGIEY